MQNKGIQKWTVIIIVALLIISLIGTSFVSIIGPDEETLSDNAIEKEYQQRKLVVETLSKKVQENPEDRTALLALADAYYDKAGTTLQFNEPEYQEDLNKALELYQQVLAVGEDNLVLLKVANTAFMSGNTDLAEKSYQDLLISDPKNVEALYGYGMFLLYRKNDHKAAEVQWQKALELAQDADLRKGLEEMIALAKGMEIKPAQPAEEKSTPAQK